MNSAFVVLGIALFGMCYFILQEEIRAKASQVRRQLTMGKIIITSA